MKDQTLETIYHTPEFAFTFWQGTFSQQVSLDLCRTIGGDLIYMHEMDNSTLKASREVHPSCIYDFIKFKKDTLIFEFHLLNDIEIKS